MACAALFGTIVKGKRKMRKMLKGMAEDLEEWAPTWRGRVLYEKLSSIQAGLKRPEPNVEIQFLHTMDACLKATRPIPAGEYFNLALSSTWIKNEEEHEDGDNADIAGTDEDDDADEHDEVEVDGR
eukprot:gnl/TRDRNA2_/TRDRNA2_125234_c0_seq1.p2 gnl/TRDRNA2_/TRDRNA2_125234_c0~~gnl/TRDRNA2_/TRDRNA2_125234_c0_seq1.p2  ORF type:complete len:138 (-),score=25.87 gnl/TRDRNA2_/TRDRNA2_125234_c0_seq1:39-416(-)